MMRFLLAVGLSCPLALTAVTRFAQKEQNSQKKAPQTEGEAAAGTFAWGHGLSYVRNHFVKAAEEFPEDKYGYRATEETRTFGEIIMHVARTTHLVAAGVLGIEDED